MADGRKLCTRSLAQVIPVFFIIFGHLSDVWLTCAVCNVKGAVRKKIGSYENRIVPEGDEGWYKLRSMSSILSDRVIRIRTEQCNARLYEVNTELGTRLFE